MNKKLLVVAALVTGALGSANTFAASSVHFTGTVVDSPCQVSVNDGNTTVDLGEASKSYIATKGNKTDDVNFDILLKGCTFTDQTKASFSFTGTPDADDPASLANTGDATGVAVQIKDSGKKIVPLDGTAATTTLDVVAGDNKAVFTAYMIGTGATVAEGNVDATATFTVAYQ